MKRTFISLLGLLLTVPLAAAQAPLILGVHPYLEAREVIRRFSPLADYLAEQLGREVQIRVGRDYSEHVEAIGNGDVDIAYIGPATYIRLVDSYGPPPLLGRIEAAGKPTFHGHIIAREGSALDQLSQLAGRDFAFGDQQSTMSYLVPRYMLHDAGVELGDLANSRHYSGHLNVAMAVLTGDVDAGAVKSEIYQRFASEGLISIARSPAISEHLFIARANLEPRLVEQIASLLQGLAAKGQAESRIKPIKGNATGIVAADDADYASIRTIVHSLDGAD